MLYSENRLVWEIQAPNAPSGAPVSPDLKPGTEAEPQPVVDPAAEAAKIGAAEQITTAARGSLTEIPVPEEATELKTDAGRQNIEKILGEKVETVADLRELSVEKLFQLEAKYEGVLFYAFTDFKDGNDKLNFDKWKEFYQKPQDGAEFTINFYDNDDAYCRMGADDILPPTVRKITVYKDGDRENSRTSDRRVGLKGRGDETETSGFFDKKGYIPVFTKDIVVIGGVDMSFDTKYRKPPTQDESAKGKLGQLDFDAYNNDKEVSAANKTFLDSLPPDAPKSKYHNGGSLGSDLKHGLELDTKGRNLGRILENQPDMYYYMHKYRDSYAAKTNIDIPESIMFAIMNRESGFGVTKLNGQNSGAGGLFQFMPKTWASFLDANPDMRNKLAADPVWGKMNQLEWRFNPEMMIAAGYWYATANMQNLRQNKGSFSYTKFTNSDLYRKPNSEIATLKQEDAWIVYLCHHDGLEGGRKMLKYEGYRESGSTEREAAEKAFLLGWQRYKITNYKPLTYDKSAEYGDAHFKFVVSGDVVKMSKRYESILAGMTPPETGTNWGWEGGDKVTPDMIREASDKRDLSASEIRLMGSSLFVDAASRLEFKGDKIPHAKEKEYVQSGKTIQAMHDDLIGAIERGEFDGVKSTAIIGGGNDIRAGKSPEEIIANLEDMTNRLLAVNPNMRIVLVTMPPVTGYNGKGANGQRLTFEPGSNEKIKTLNEWIKTKAQNSKHVGCVDLYNMVEDPARPGYINPKYNGDGLHLNSAGYRILREAVSGELLAVER